MVGGVTDLFTNSVGLPWLSAIVFLPLLGGVAVLVNGRRPGWCRWLSLAVTVLDLCLILPLLGMDARPQTEIPGQWLLAGDSPWIEALHVHYSLAADGVSVMLILLAAILGVLCVLVSWQEITQKVALFHFFLLAMQTGVLGVFLATDLFLFYLFWEMQLIPMFFLIGVWGHEQRIHATVKFVLFTITGSLLMLLALMGVYLVHGQDGGHFSFSLMALVNTTYSRPVELLLFAAFALAFAIKVPVVLVHTWLPDAHTEAPTAGSVILAGVLLKTGAYGLFRIAFPLFPHAAAIAAPWLLSVGLAGMFYAGWIALAQQDLKRLVAYSSVAHMGLIVVGLAVWNTTTVTGSLLQMLNHGVTTSALFIMVGMLDARLHTRKLSQLGGLWKVLPVWSGFFLFFVLASLGLPGLNNFIGELIILVGAFRNHPWVAAAGFLGLLWTLIYCLRMLDQSLWGECRPQLKASDLGWREVIILIPLLVLVLWLGIYPMPVLTILQSAVTGLR
ncbi:MAG TPA: NADH-quinone oxidoreductase subunit M [Syntrophobacteraceae bacterium]|nr:NADH-quinone oxidoreductase subunit M [Syntrophobacteraceae bacterium]